MKNLNDPRFYEKKVRHIYIDGKLASKHPQPLTLGQMVLDRDVSQEFMFGVELQQAGRSCRQYSDDLVLKRVVKRR
jgi:hypothetical protein